MELGNFFIWGLMGYAEWCWQVVVIDWCYICKKDGKTIDHLFIHFPVARELWNWVVSLFGV